MKIAFAKNPLYSTIELDEHEKKELWYTIKIKEYEDMIFNAHFHLEKDSKYFDIEKARKGLDPEYWCTDEKSKLDTRVDELFQYCIESLTEAHVGDCICVACSCSKCHTETMLGVSTINGLGKQAANQIDSAFGKNNERTIDEAIIELENYNPPPPIDMSGWDRVGGWEKHLPRWKSEAALAASWLKNYRDTNLKGN